MVLGPGAVLGDPLQIDPRVGGQVLPLGQLLLGEQPRLDPLGQLDLLLGVQQGHLADLLQVILDRIRGGTGHRDLRGRKIIIVIAEDEDLLVLAGAVRRDLDDGGARRGGGLGSGGHLRGRLVRSGLVRSVLASRAVLVPGQFVASQFVASQFVASQILTCLGDVNAEVGLGQVLVGERGLDVHVVGVQIVESRLGVDVRLVEIHRGQALGR